MAANPLPGSPSRLALGTFTFLKTTSHCLSPATVLSIAISMPGDLESTRNSEMPSRSASLPAVRAATTIQSETFASGTKSLIPSIT